MLKDTRERRRLGTALLLTTCLGAGLTGPARKADASAHEAWRVPALQTARMSVPLPERTRREHRRLATGDDPIGAGDGDPGRALEQAAVTLHLTGAEAELLRSMLHEAVTNDLDLLEDTVYQHELVDSEAVARIALAVRLDIGMG